MVAQANRQVVGRGRWGRALAVAFVGVGMSLTTGCAGTNDEMSHELAKMQSEVMNLRAHTSALTERLEALEGRSPAPVAPAVAAPDERPELRVVHLGPTDDPVTVDAPDAAAAVEPVPESRVSIRSTPSGLVQDDPDAPASSRPKTTYKPKPIAKNVSSKPDAAKKN